MKLRSLAKMLKLFALLVTLLSFISGCAGSIIDEGDFHLPLAKPKEKPPHIYGEEIDDDTDSFIVLTWNVNKLTNKTAKDENKKIELKLPVKPPNKPKAEKVVKAEAIFKTVLMSGADIALLQEVHTDNKNSFPLEGHDYKILKGDPLVRGGEYCPILFRPNKFSCKEWRTDPKSRIHWAKCTINSNDKIIYFGSGHANEANTRIFKMNIGAMFKQLDQKPKNKDRYLKPRVGNNSKMQDNFILGMDANSNPIDPTKGYRKKIWKKARERWDKDHNNNKGAIKIPDVGPKGTATKIHKKDEKIRVHSDKAHWIIDFFVISLKKDDVKVEKIEAVDVRLLNPYITGQPYWVEYFDKLSDHIPVKGEFKIVK